MDSSETSSLVEIPSDAAGAWAEVSDLPCELTVELSVPSFTIADLLALDTNALVDTQRKDGTHVPVHINGQMIGWAEFDVVDDRLVVRMTELA